MPSISALIWLSTARSHTTLLESFSYIARRLWSPTVCRKNSRKGDTMATQPGWYDDGSGQQRYWDGNEWTEHVAGAAPTAGGPAATVPGAATPKKRRVGMWIGISIGAVVLLCGGGIALLVALVFNATSGPREAVDDVFDALEKGDCTALYSHLHSDLTGGLSEVEFCADGTTPTEVSHSIKSVSVENDRDAVVRVEATIGSGMSGSDGVWDYILVKEDGEWLLREIEPVFE